MAASTDPGFPASEPLSNQHFQDAEIEQSAKRRELAFEQINEVTWKLTDGRGSIAWSGDRSGGHRTNRAVAWLMGIGLGRWIVRYRNKASKPMKLPAARKYALEMVKGIVLAEPSLIRLATSTACRRCSRSSMQLRAKGRLLKNGQQEQA